MAAGTASIIACNSAARPIARFSLSRRRSLASISVVISVLVPNQRVGRAFDIQDRDRARKEPAIFSRSPSQPHGVFPGLAVFNLPSIAGEHGLHTERIVRAHPSPTAAFPFPETREFVPAPVEPRPRPVGFGDPGEVRNGIREAAELGFRFFEAPLRENFVGDIHGVHQHPFDLPAGAARRLVSAIEVPVFERAVAGRG